VPAKKLGNNYGEGTIHCAPTTNCHSLERGNPAYFHIFLLSKKTTKIRVTETLRKNLKYYPKKVDF
jgi:hypothetical protein